MTDDPLILWLDHGSAPGNPLLGGKFASLAEMTAAGFSVPPGFGVTTAAYRAFMEHADLRPEAERVRDAAPDMAVVDIGKDRARLVEAIGASPMPEALETAIRHGYRLLEERTNRAGVPVAVRSSGEAEDLADASFAGQYDTYLWIVGGDAVLRHVRACWASMFGDTALTYRAGGDDAAAAGGGICVGIQQMVEARAAGVMFTLDPLNGDRSKIVMEACWGLGEGVVKGDVTPSRFTIDKVTLEIVKRDVVSSVGGVPLRSRLGRGQADADLRPSGHARPASTTPRRWHSRNSRNGSRDGAVRRRISNGRSAQDGDVRILQVRPETVWSQRESAGLVSESRSAVGHVLARLSGGRVAGAGPGHRNP